MRRLRLRQFFSASESIAALKPAAFEVSMSIFSYGPPDWPILKTFGR